jgi:hypothetical protein
MTALRLAPLLAFLAGPAHAEPKWSCTTHGKLEICGKYYNAPSHGGLDAIRNAHYTAENRGTTPITVAVTSLEVVGPDGHHHALAPRDTKPFIVAPGKRIDVDVYGTGSIAAFRYHTEYHHEVRFRMGTAVNTIAAGELYFRHPRAR